MNILFCHLAKFNLQYFHKQTALFDNFIKGSFFEIALNSFTQASNIDKIALIFPESDHPLINEKLSHLNLRSSKIILLPLSEISANSFKEKNIFFDPMFMKSTPAFGAWDFKFIESQSRKIPFTKFIILNMEDFWFLKAEDLNKIIASSKVNNFSFQTQSSGFYLLAASLKKAKMNFAKHVNAKTRSKKQLKENFNNLTALSKIDTHTKINQRREEYLNKHTRFSPKITDILDKDYVPDTNIFNLIKGLSKNPLALSLSYNFGINNLRLFNQLAKIPSILSDKNDFQELFLNKPKIMRIQLQDKDNYISLSSFKNALEIMSEVKFLILEDYNQFEEKNLVTLIKYAFNNLTAHLYLESSCINFDSKMLNNLFKNGLSVFIIDIDRFLLEKSILEFELLIESLLTVRDKNVNRFVMLKKKNILDDPDYIPLLIHRWQYLVDGIIITRSDNQDEAYKVNTNQKQCSIIPYEIYLKSNSKFALCKNMLQKEYTLNNYELWLKQARLAPEFETCQTCLDKKNYKYVPAFNLAQNKINKSLVNLQKESSLHLIQTQIDNKDYLQALISTEEILKVDPTNLTAWQLITQIETSLNP